MTKFASKHYDFGVHFVKNWHEKWKKDIFLSIKDNNKHKNRTAKSFFVLEINPIQDPDDATGE